MPDNGGQKTASPGKHSVITHLAQQIEDLLPQTQCTKCGFAGCAPYARAIADGTAQINQCPPGGQEGVSRLAHLLGRAS
ncbi:MAG: RnfABCDGE type electron transport complex subunit B, partial [Janthinobacterium lividum]